MSGLPTSPGEHIRASVIPKGMKIAEAARRLSVSRPALSNLLNGKAELSPEMAARLEAAFKVSARRLLEDQAVWRSSQKGGAPSAASTIKAYVPPFLELRASSIERWAGDGIKPRKRLAVLLRTLVNSTGPKLVRVDFPGNDESERAGWDGEVDATQPTPWIPLGRSGWEFGVNKDVKAKADADFAKSVRANPDREQREKITFVFVTPRRWLGKGDWASARRAEGHWNDVRVYDAADLEQWLEQSVAAQVWFANETGLAGHGALSLDEAWKRWSADCEPELRESLFEEAVSASRLRLEKALEGDACTPTVIVADSKDEALGFLSAAFSTTDAKLGRHRDRIIVFTEPGVLSKLAATSAAFIPVIMDREIEREFAPFRSSIPSFIIYPRNATSADADISLETLSYEAFRKALSETGLEQDRIDQLSRESGRSPTVLRRRLSRLPAIQAPIWSTEQDVAESLLPLLFAGAWKSDNPTDQAMLEALAATQPLDIERRVARLAALDAAPLWAVGTFRGVVSAIDVLFAVRNVVTTKDLERFFDVAELVLSEINPVLDLPEDRRWAAAIYGKGRQISGALRDGICEMLVLLAVHGNSLFKTRLGLDVTARAEKLVSALLEPFDVRVLESESSNLPLYAEAAPEKFLSLVEDDLARAEPESLKLMRPIKDTLFETAPRTGLLWALENLAWSERYLLRTVLVLARLAEPVVNDNLSNRPSGSLSAIFRSWMPQTGAPLDRRNDALTELAKRFPGVAWPVCLDQFAAHQRVGMYSHKPRWRPDGHGRGEPVAGQERNDFALHAFRLALEWPMHTRETLGDLVANLAGLSEELRIAVWDKVDAWSQTASEADQAWLREKIRVSTLSRRSAARRAKAPEASDVRAMAAFQRLRVSNPLLRHAWLFRQAWVEESADELGSDTFDFAKWEQRVVRERESAVREVYEHGGAPAVAELAEAGQTPFLVGRSLAAALPASAELVQAILTLARVGEMVGWRTDLVAGALASAEEDRPEVLSEVLAGVHADRASSVMRAAPFGMRTWALVEAAGTEASANYWRGVMPNWNRDLNELAYALRHLVKADRPRAAFQLARFDLKSLPPRLVYEVLAATASSSGEPSGVYLLDPHHLREAFAVLGESGEISTNELAPLEFQFIDIWDLEESGPVNLQRQIAESPDLFVQAVAFTYKRSDGMEDPVELRSSDETLTQGRATACYKLLEKLSLTPGTEDGEVNPDKLLKWLRAAQAGCRTIGRGAIGDQCIGKLVSHAPVDPNGVWPCLPVRDVLEQFTNEDVGAGIRVAFYNSRGVHFSGGGGSGERELATRYAGWAASMEYTHPRLASILRSMESQYLREAEWNDTEARITRRMRS